MLVVGGINAKEPTAPVLNQEKAEAVSMRGPATPRSPLKSQEGSGMTPEQERMRSVAGMDGVLICPTDGRSVALHDLSGNRLLEWKMDNFPAAAPRRLADGGLLYLGALNLTRGVHAHFRAAEGQGGVVEKWSPDGRLTWRFQMATDQYFIHHDAVPLRNGNVLLLVWRWRSSEEALAAGRLPQHLPLDGFWTDEVWEVRPAGDIGGTIVWQWSAWDYRVQDTTPEIGCHGTQGQVWRSVDLNQPRGRVRAWADLRRIEVSEDDGIIAVWSRHFNEVWILDHRVPHPYTAESVPPPPAAAEDQRPETASRQGKESPPQPGLLFRLGNPQLFGRKSTLTDLMAGFQDMAFGQRGGQSGLLLVHGYNVKGDGTRTLVDFLPSSRFRGDGAPASGAVSASGSTPVPTLPIDAISPEKLGLPAGGGEIGGLFPLEGGRWLVTDRSAGIVQICAPGQPPRKVWQASAASAPASVTADRLPGVQRSRPTRSLIQRASAAPVIRH